MEIKEFKKSQHKLIDPKILDIGLNYKIITMTSIVNISDNINIDIKKFAKIVKLNEDNIVQFSYNNVIESLYSKKNNKNKKNFYNQITFKVRPDIDSDRSLSLKLFYNGKLQITGLKSIEDINNVINRFLDNFQQKHYKYYSDKQIKKLSSKKKKKLIGNFKKVKFYKGNVKLDIIKKFNIKDIRLLNIKKNTGYDIDRNKLNKLLKHAKEHVIFNPEEFQGLKWKKKVNNSNLTIIIYTSGKITLTLNPDSKEDIKIGIKYIDEFFGNKFIKNNISKNKNILNKLSKQENLLI